MSRWRMSARNLSREYGSGNITITFGFVQFSRIILN